MRNSKSVRYCTFLCGMVISCPAPPHGFCPICTNNSSPYPPVPNAFGGSFGGKIRLAFKKSILSGAHLSAQLWFYCEHKFLEVHARARPCDISNKFYFPVSSCMPCPFQPAFAAVSLPACTIAYYSPRCREKRPCLGAFQPHRHHARPITVTPEVPRFVGIFYTMTGFTCAGFSCTGKPSTTK